jgi:virginiamycin B lyase
MTGVRLSCGFLVASVIPMLAAIGVAAAQLSELPAGPNRELVQRACTGCHDLGMVFDTGGLSREDWDGTLTMMETYGLEVTAADRRLILQYLATYLPPRQ